MPDPITTTAAEIARAVWDAQQAGHKVAGSFGEYYGPPESLSSGNIRGATLNSIKLGEGAPKNLGDGNCFVVISSGTGAGQQARITGYSTFQDTYYLDGDWLVIPDATSQYYVFRSSEWRATFLPSEFAKLTARFDALEALIKAIPAGGGTTPFPTSMDVNLAQVVGTKGETVGSCLLSGGTSGPPAKTPDQEIDDVLARFALILKANGILGGKS